MAIKNQKSASEKLIYVGPNLSRGRLLQYQVFIGGLPTHLDEEFAAEALICACGRAECGDGADRTARHAALQILQRSIGGVSNGL